MNGHYVSIVIDNKLFCVFCGIFVSLILDIFSLVYNSTVQFYLYHETTRLSKQNATFRASVGAMMGSEARIITIMPVPPSNWPLRSRRAYKCPAFTPLLRSARPEGSLAIVVGPLLTMLIAYKCYNQGNDIQKSRAYGWKVCLFVAKKSCFWTTWAWHAMQSVTWCLLCWLRIVRLFPRNSHILR